MDQAERNLVKHRRPRAYESEVSLERLLVSLLEVLALVQHSVEVKVHIVLMWRSELELRNRCTIDWLQPTLKHNGPSMHEWPDWKARMEIFRLASRARAIISSCLVNEEVAVMSLDLIWDPTTILAKHMLVHLDRKGVI